MEYNNEELLKLLTSDTPFRMQEGCHIVLENQNPNCTHAQINTMLNKRLLNPIDMEIMILLSTYRFLNSYNISYFLNELSSLKEYYKKPDYVRNLKKMVKAGILERYSFIPYPKDANMAIESMVNAQAAAPLRFYDLTPGSYSYINSIADHPHHYTAAADDSRRMELLSLNQFLFRFKKHYGKHIISVSYLLSKKIGNTTFTIDALLKYRVTNKIIKDKGPLFLFVLSVRQTNGFMKKFISRLRLTFLYLERHNQEFPFFMVLVLIENIKIAIDIYAQIQSIPLLKEQPLYFAPDAPVNVYPPLDCIYTCSHSETDNRICANRNRIII